MQRIPRNAVVAVAVTALIIPLLATPAVAGDSDDLVAHYALDETGGAVATDSSGQGNDATYIGGPTLTGESATLDGLDDHVSLPKNILAGLDSITVSTEVLIRPEQSTPYFIFGLGNPATSSSGAGYLFATGNSYRASITKGNWSGEQSVNSGVNLDRGVWKTITYTLDDASDTARLYLDGLPVAEQTGITVKPSEIGGGLSASNFIGKSNYASDRYLAGSVRNFRIYSTALAATEVAALVPDDAIRVSRDASALDIGDLSAIQDDIELPFAGINGSKIAWESDAPGTISDSGLVTRPGAGSDNAIVVLTATISSGGATKTRTFTATVIAMPDDQAAVDAAATTLSIPNLNDIRGNITLPSAPEPTRIEWSSSNQVVVGTDGVVNRQSADATVTLTARLTLGSASATRDFTATVRKAFAVGSYEGYTFAYFTGDSLAGENIYFAASEGNNALDWRELNGGRPVLQSTEGTKGLRDPFLIRSPEGDTFYLVATDLSIGSGTSWGSSVRSGSHYVEVWESHDLVNWSNQRHVKVAPDNAGNAWAPEAFYDDTIGAYVLFWASSLYADDDPGHSGSSYHRMMYVTTRDFVTFSEAQIWQDQGMSRIDSTVIKDADTYYRFTKDEGAGGTGCSDIIEESSTSLRASLDAWTMVDSCIGRDAGTRAVEGPTAFKANPGDVNGEKFYLFVDEYGDRGYIPLETEDVANPDWQVSASYRLPASPRHGTVIPVTADELAALGSGPAAAPVNDKGEILRYSFEDAAGTVVADVSGNGQDGTVVGSAAWSSNALGFDGVDDYVDLPDNLLARVADITIEADVWLDSDLSGAYFIYGLGNTLSGAGNGYLFTSGNSYRTSLATGNWTTEQTVTQGVNLPRARWAHLTYVVKGSTATIYLDGIAVATGTVTTDPGDIGGGITTANYLGRSNYDADKKFKGKFREFAIFNRARTAAEVLDASGNTTALTGATLAEDVLKIAPIINSDAREVTFPVDPGTDLTALTPVFDVASGVLAEPASGTTRDLSAPALVTLTQTGGGATTWTLRTVEMNTPTIPGLYADPNIIAFGDTYYVYATTDGAPGWGGKDFYVWKSRDLVSWERTATPFLTLDGAAGNVPWATGNAWAPTIAEKNGKYYFYFSGHHGALNRKTIGVAVADHPEGPYAAEPEAMILNNEAVTSGQAIDPAIFTDPKTSKSYIFWGNGSPVYAELADDMVSVKVDSFKRINGLTDFREGLFLNYREGLYHLTYSIDDTGSPNYRVGYATSTSVDGPWAYRGVVLEKDASQGILATGHNSVLNVPGTDDWYMVYHRFAMPGGNGNNRETTFDRITFDPVTGLMNSVIPTLTGVPAQTVVDPAPLEVNIEGVARVGETLSARTNDPWSATEFAWSRDEAAIPGATGPDYVLVAGDEGATIKVEVSAAKTLWTPARAQASAGPVLPAGLDPDPKVSAAVSGPAENAAGWRNGAVSVALTLDPGAGGGAALGIQYRAGGNWTEYTSAIEVSADGSHAIEYRATADGRPIDATQSSTTVRIDALSPVSAAVLDPADALGTANSPVSLAVTAQDATSGVAVIEYRIGAGDWKPMPGAGLTFTEVGASVVFYRAVDRAGNAEAARSVVVTITDPAFRSGKLELDSTKLTAGDTFVVRGSGFDGDERVELTLHSLPVHLGAAQTDAAGAFAVEITLAEAASLGEHSLRASGVASGVMGEIAVTVVATDAPGTGALPVTGAALAGVAVAALAAILLGVTFVTMRRRGGRLNG